MFRSEEVVLCQLFVQQEAAFASIHMLGEAGVVEFRDLNAEVHPMMRKFVNEVRRCEELERKLRYIEEEMGKDGVAVDNPRHQPRPALNPRDIIELEANLEKTESEIMELSRNAANLQASFVELTEMQQVLEKAQVFLKELEELPSKVFAGEDRGRLGVTAGVLPRERLPAFETMLWRVSRGNVLLRQADLDDLVKDPKTGLEVQKTVFVIFFQGDNLRSAVTKVCSGFRATTYPCPGTALERAETLRDLRVRLQDLILILDQTWFHRHRVLAAVRKELREWRVVAVKTKAVYHTLNMFNMDVTNKCLIGECWVPVRDLAALRHVLVQGGAVSGSSVPPFVNVIPTALQPPTFVPTNKFTAGFQALIDAYSVASYREVNPAAYSIVTFPFLFAVMFGDLGHGLLMALFALAMVLGEDGLATKVRGSEIMTIFFGGRYIILLMGLFSMYTGLMYNDLFSVSVNLVGWSAWSAPPLSELQPGPTTLDPSKHYQGVPYPIGLDPVWQFAENKIIFLNSFKMKLSIIIGIIHMVFGVSLSVFNHVANRRPVMILLDFLPKILFLLLIFGYLAALMVFKWWKYGPEQGAEDMALSPGCAPSVLITFINMMLRNHPDLPAGSACSPWMYGGQAGVEQALLYSALACVPFMLLARPAYVLCTQRRRRPKRPRNDAVRPVLSPIRGMDDDDADVADDAKVAEDDAVADSAHSLAETGATTPAQDDDDAVTWRHDEDGDDQSEDKAAEDEEPFGEMMVHQCIHTVEYVLSTVSHTASYLRLWALSLAHSQLSHVLWSMVLRKGLAMQWVLPLLFAGWAFFTVAILVLMEGLSAFLHTLRLHWVEFMSKFYEGEGYPFRPFSFKTIFQSVD